MGAPAGGTGLTPEENLRLNERALQNYRDGWELGDSDVILKYSPESFTFTWENNQVVTKKDFPAFFAQFVKDAEAETNKKYVMRFESIIHRTVGETTYEAAEWIVDGYDRGVYFNAAKNGKMIWDMATTEPGLRKQCV